MSFRVFFRCAAEAVLIRGAPALRGLVPLGEVLGEVSREAFHRAQQRIREAQLRHQLHDAVLAPLPDVQQTVSEVIEEVRLHVPETRGALERPEVASALRRYLLQVPSSARRALRRLADPCGTSLPQDLALLTPDHLTPFLPARLARFQPGDRAGGWVLAELLSAGGFSELWRAECLTSRGATQAVFKFGVPAGSAAALRREADNLERVKAQAGRPGLVALRKIHPEEPFCLEYDHVPTCDLSAILPEWERLAPETAVARATAVVRRLAQTLGPLHRLRPPLVHGNLKPAHVLVQKGEKGVVVWLAELGLGALAARWWLAEAHRLAVRRGDLMLARSRGSYSPLYCSPQHRLGAAPQPRDDVYALGVMWYQLAAGELRSGPGEDWASRLTDRGMARKAVALLGACLSSQPEDRPADAQELAERLAALSAAPAPAGSARRAAAGSAPRRGLLTVDLGGGQELKLAPVPPGCFLMGSPEDEEGRRPDEGPQRWVTIAEGFHLGVCPVTQAQWQAVMGSNPSRFHGDDRPVEMVSWQDAQAFCRKLRERTGGRFRLPTEAEWEYACRAGTTTPFSFGETISAELANYYAEDTYGEGQPGVYREETKAVGSFPPNAWGLCDMHGNVFEWCADWYGEDYYGSGEEADPQGPRSGTARVIRGGSWAEGPAFCRSACRDKCSPSYRVALIGFRVLLCGGLKERCQS